MTWTIVTDPNTLLREFATSRPFAEAGWRYVKAEAYGSDAPSHTECSLRYDPETWRATFRRPVTLNSAAGYSLSAVRAPSTPVERRRAEELAHRLPVVTITIDGEDIHLTDHEHAR